MTVLSLRFCARAFSSCGEWGPLFIAVRGPLTVAASFVAEHGLQTRRLSSCGSQAQLLRGMRDLPRPGHEPVSPELAGRLSTTAPPGKPRTSLFKKAFFQKVRLSVEVNSTVMWSAAPLKLLLFDAASFKNSASREGSRWWKMEIWTWLDSIIIYYLLKLEILLKVNRRDREAFGQRTAAWEGTLVCVCVCVCV